MAYSGSGSGAARAYDLSAYDLPKRRQPPQLRAVRSPRRVISAAFTPRALSSFAIVVTLLCLIVYNQAQLTEINGEINTLNSTLRDLESDNVKLNSELESAVNLRAIGEQAQNELGMHRLGKHQIEYVCLQQEDKIVLTEDSPDMTLGQKIKLTVTTWIARLQEYIGGR